MNVLFVHNNFPGQFGAWAQHLAYKRHHTVRAIGGRTATDIPGVTLHRYQLTRGSSKGIHDFAVRFEADCIRAEAAAKAADQLSRAGFKPDVIVAHIGWGESLMLRDVWPHAKVIAYCEFYYRSEGQDVNFDAEFDGNAPDLNMKVRAKNAGTTLALADADYGLSPTEWQRSTYPDHLQSRITVIHDGIDTSDARPRLNAQMTLPGRNLVLRSGDEVITYVNRHLEPMRGLHIFLRALPRILQARPQAQVVIIGAPATVAYGGLPIDGRPWKDRFMEEIIDLVDSSRLHWLGRVTKPTYLDALAVSRVHVYLTYPFVLSWSLLEAMSCGCLVVASDTAPVREVATDKNTAALVDFFDVERLGEQVIRGLSRPRDEFSAITAAARQGIVDRFDRDKVCMPRLVELIERNSF